jgi:hypothetical protein
MHHPVAAGGWPQDVPSAIEHRWPEGPSSGMGSHRIPGFLGREFVRDDSVHGVGGLVSSDPIVIDDSPPSAPRSSRGNVHVVVLSSDSD